MHRKHIQEKLLSTFDNQIVKQTPRYVRNTFCNLIQNNKTITSKPNRQKKTFLSVLSKTHSFSMDHKQNNQTESVNQQNKINSKNILKKSGVVIGGQPKLKINKNKKSLRLHSSTVSLTSNCSTKKSIIYNIQDKFNKRKSLSRMCSSKVTTPASFTIQDQNHLNLIERLVQQKINSKINDINNSCLSKNSFNNQKQYETNNNLDKINKKSSYLNNYESKFDFSTPVFKKDKIDSHREKQIVQQKTQVKQQSKKKSDTLDKENTKQRIKQKRRASVGQIYSTSNKPFKSQILQQVNFNSRQTSNNKFQNSQNKKLQVIISNLPSTTIRYASQAEAIAKTCSDMFSDKPYQFYQQKGLQRLSYSRQFEAEQCLEKVEEIKNQISNLQNLISSRIKLAEQRSKSLTVSRVTDKFQVYNSATFNTVNQQTNNLLRYSSSKTLKKQQHQNTQQKSKRHEIPLRSSLVQYRKYECPTQDIKSQLLEKINNHSSLNQTKCNKQYAKSSILNKQNDICSTLLQSKLKSQSKSNQFTTNYQRSFGNTVDIASFRNYQ